MANMTIKIENRWKKRVIFFNVDNKIRQILSVVPKEHLIGIEKIIVVDEIKTKKGKTEAAATYNRKDGRELASIEISIDAVYHGMPKTFFMLPFIAKFSLASALYHEIGHHYHYSYKHGINKQNKEAFAEKYSSEMLKKAFWGWLIILRPFSPIIRYLSGRHKKNRK
jgi:hypothetical protein